MFDAAVTTPLEHGAECIDVVAQVRRGVDQRIAHARLRGHVCDVGGARAAKKNSGRRCVGKIERLAANADLLQPGRARALERDVIIRIEAVDGDTRRRPPQAMPMCMPMSGRRSRDLMPAAPLACSTHAALVL